MAMVYWTKLRVLGSVVGLVGAWGVLQALVDLPTLFSRLPVPNLVYRNDQRLPPLDALEQLRTAFPSNFATVFGFILLAVLLGILFFGLLPRLYGDAPVRTLLAGLFLGGSVLAMVPLAITILKVSEFSFQATVATPEESQWLEGGVTFLNQLHLIFVHSWFLLSGLGWIFLGLAAQSGPSWRRRSGAVALGGGGAVVGGEVLRAWLPRLGETVPMMVASSEAMLVDGGMALGFLGSGLLAWFVSAPVARNFTSGSGTVQGGRGSLEGPARARTRASREFHSGP